MLFLDEFTEFRRDAVEGLRQPLEAFLGRLPEEPVEAWIRPTTGEEARSVPTSLPGSRPEDG